MNTCEYCLKPFESKRAHASTCSSKCRVALARKKAREQAAEEGDPGVEWVPQDGTNELPGGASRCEPEAVTIPPAPNIELRKKLPLSETPLRADVNALARQVIAGMKQGRPLTGLELLEKNQLK